MKLILRFLVSVAILSHCAQASVLSYWTFDDPGNPHADNVGGVTLSDPAAAGEQATWGASSGYNGSGGYTFDGGDRLIAGLDINPGAIPEMTMGAWVRTDSLASGLRKVMGHDNGAWDRTLGLDDRTAAAGGPQAAPALRYSAFTGTNNFGPIQSTLAPTNMTDWTFLAVTYSQVSNTATIYIDLDATTIEPLFSASSATVMGPGQTSFSIGSLRPDNAAEGWIGSIDQAFILDHVASAAELTQFRDQGFVVPEPSTAAYALLIGGILMLRRKRRA